LVDEVGKFTINVQHSMIKQFRSDLSDEQARDFDRILKLISKTIPIGFIRGIPSVQENDFVDRFDDRKESVELVRRLIETAVGARLGAGETLTTIRQSLLWVEPFSDFPDLIEQVIAERIKASTN